MSEWPDAYTIAKEVNSGKTSAKDNVLKSLKLLEDTRDYQAVIEIIKDRSVSRAEQIDQKVANAEHAGVLAGVPFIAKDNFLTFGSNTTAASNILKNFKAPYQSTAIEKLEAAGAICVGKANLDAFGHGASTENSDWFVTKNPHDKSRVAGGSSGGSAATVVLGAVSFALGTDTGGSSRQPASFCGCIGYKPTYGLVSRSGVIAMASSTDVVGILANSVDTTAQVLEVISGKDPLDGTTINRDPKGYLLNNHVIKGKKFGLVKEYMGEGVDRAVKQSILQAVDKISNDGGQVVEVSIPSVELALACYYIVMPAEVSSNLSRYDGQKFGYSSKSADTLDDSYFKSRTEGFGPEAKRRIMIGTYVLTSGYYDAYYKKAQLVRTKIINEYNKVFDKVDFLLGPVSPTTAFKIGEKSKDPLSMYLADVMTVASNLTGAPSISVPIEPADNMPVGLQIMGQQRGDRELLQISSAIEGVYR